MEVDPDADLDASVQFLVASRFWIQKVLVPIAVFVGVCGNIITVMVLTRRRMRCTTTIYLTALAVADIIYLLFVLLLSCEKYDRIHEKRFELYWRFFGISHWICDAASSTSVWLTVSFTIERYIVVCHPIKGKVHCTEARAKSIITIVSILCLISTASTTFEYQLKVDETCIRKYCDDNILGNNTLELDNFNNTSEYEHHVAKRSSVQLEDTSEEQRLKMVPQNLSKKAFCEQEEEGEEEGETAALTINSTECCEMRYVIGTEPTSLAYNSVYTTTFYWFSSIGFGLLPLVLIATFNTFLVHAVYRSQKQRRRLTNAAENSSQNNENRITLLLISVVFLFLMCQTPTAVYLIYAAFQSTKSEYVMNIEKGLGNIFNFLLTVNASCNFVLYCVLSAKFRRTFQLVFCSWRKGNDPSNRRGASIMIHSSYNNSHRSTRQRRNLDDTSCAEGTTLTSTLDTSLSRCPTRNRRGQDTTDFTSNNTTRYTNLPQQLSEEEEGDIDDVDDCSKDLVGGTGTNGQAVLRQNGHPREQGATLKTPRNIETLSLTSMPRTRPMLMRPIGKARSTDLVV